MINSGIYKILNTINGDFYIGSACHFRKRWENHLYELRKNKHHSIHLQRAWNKYGEQAFEFKILLYCDIENLLYYEQTLIDGLKPVYNTCRTAGNCLGRIFSDEAKLKMSNSHKGIYPSEETKLKRSKALKDRVFSEETKRKISEAKKGKPNGRLNTHHSEETKRKMSEAAKNRSA